MYWTPVLRFAIEGSMDLSVSVTIEYLNSDLYSHPDSSIHKWISFGFAVSVSIILIGAIIFIYVFLRNKTEDELLENAELLRKFGPILEGLKLKRAQGITYYVVFMIRRIATACIYVLL